MGTLFINYRRGETAGEARALFNELAATLGKDSVFMDVDSIALGRDFREVLHERLASCDLMLALIGRDWANSKDASGRRRLEDPTDFVRLEIEAALKRNIPVTPVLVQGAQMPGVEHRGASRTFATVGSNGSHSRWTQASRAEMVGSWRQDRPVRAIDTAAGGAGGTACRGGGGPASRHLAHGNQAGPAAAMVGASLTIAVAGGGFLCCRTVAEGMQDRTAARATVNAKIMPEPRRLGRAVGAAAAAGAPESKCNGGRGDPTPQPRKDKDAERLGRARGHLNQMQKAALLHRRSKYASSSTDPGCWSRGSCGSGVGTETGGD